MAAIAFCAIALSWRHFKTVFRSATFVGQPIYSQVLHDEFEALDSRGVK